jgi:hypothetical protein
MKTVTILPHLTRRTVQIRSHQTGVYWRPSVLLPSQPVTTATASKVRGKQVRTALQAEESSASSSEEGRSCIRRLQTPAAAKQQIQQKATTTKTYLKGRDQLETQKRMEG